jgi:hypothetical protein
MPNLPILWQVYSGIWHSTQLMAQSIKSAWIGVICRSSSRPAIKVMLAPAFLAFVREPWLADKSKSTQKAMIRCKARQIIRDTERVAESNISSYVLSQRY